MMGMNGAANAVFSVPVDDLRKRLLEAVVDAQDEFIKSVQIFYDTKERADTDCLQLAESIVNTVDTVLAAGDWDSSVFLQTVIKPLRGLREEVINMRHGLLQEQGDETVQQDVLLPNQTKIYVSLYQADGHSMSHWEGQLASIDCYMVGRPIYKQEVDVQQSIRQKLMQIVEAYAVLVVDQADILASGGLKTDRYGHPLLSVEASKINASHVREFVHAGKRYRYHRQRLILMEQA